jgi:surface protein
MAATPPPTRPDSNRITEDQYKVARYLTRITKKNPRYYNQVLFPLLRQYEIGPLQRKHAILRRTDQDIRPAVDLWCNNRDAAEEQYGHIGYWDVSRVTNMQWLFAGQELFNDDITHWDVSNVTDMSYMFFRASAFNQNIGGWNVSMVTNMSHMFNLAESFNQNIGDWDVSNVTDMDFIFDDALEFNQNISGWNVINVTEYYRPFGPNSPISPQNKPAKFLGSGGAKNRRRASRKRVRKGTRSRKGRRTLKRGSRRTRRR